MFHSPSPMRTDCSDRLPNTLIVQAAGRRIASHRRMPASEYTVFFLDNLRVNGNVRVWR